MWLAASLKQGAGGHSEAVSDPQTEWTKARKKLFQNEGAGPPQWLEAAPNRAVRANLRDLQPRYACLDRPQRNSLVKLDVRVAG